MVGLIRQLSCIALLYGEGVRAQPDSENVDGHFIYDYASCPICGYDFEEFINDWQSNFCLECGQRLDWTLDN